PNPSAGSTVLSVGTLVRNGALTIHDASGRMVLQRAWPAGSSRYTLEAGALAPGAYVVRVASSTSASEASASATVGSAGSAARDPAGGYVGRLVVMP
ncbi:MAG: T9SS type A sorting domain-containing protein, partial [Bacteroidetes bacterium]|nr:T9SS type A sorting domain-containing protein [Bacteroidota bacterium]